ncbi:deoxyribodipyrimidine photo-lyase [Candidatus Steffania adelgidicola]|uniref:deoxyribodipyrimidine photo-lyase n=1 Tax=Candidatus Steffania adelgidicola TaxID=1076626 RepID=UPI001D012643|nr:deoxyribodipyrimidine photo-lyase [Candidatus Steffania adelgidicola]UDG80006.1 Deoxyribodipyrimidine photo-lyase [Candidatus Steffania adelgidicola]
MITRLVWLRNDLRIHDNTALHAACNEQEVKVLAVFIATPVQWRRHGMSPRQATFIYDNLIYLEQALTECQIPFLYHQCDDFNAAVRWLRNYCYKEEVKEIFYNRQYEVNERKRDLQLEMEIGKETICKGFDDGVILPPGSILNQKLQMYKIYTPFRTAFVRKLIASEISPLPSPKVRQGGGGQQKIPFFDYPHQKVDKKFPSGEKAALNRLRTFCQVGMPTYIQRRDLPGINGTSCLSPYLTIGVISPRQCLHELYVAYPDFLEKTDSSPFCWFSELIWREFYRHLIVAYPFLCMNKPFINWTDNIFWNKNPAALHAWQQGITGYPLVDAAMRQLNTIGWMHNRLRMITASFLVKNLLIDWRIGEQYFMSQLLDGDLAANNGGWQWAASTGTDAAPYFRIFNPTTQGKRYDPKGNFIRKWVPELNHVPDEYIYAPHAWLERNGAVLNYPEKIIDYQHTQKKTLAAFHAAKDYSFKISRKNSFMNKNS